MITEAIPCSLQSSFKGLETTIGNLSNDIHRLASASPSKHALQADDGNSPQSVAYSSSKHVNSQADDRISTYTPKSARLRAGVVASPPKHADSLAGGSPDSSTASEGGGPMGVMERGDEDDVLSLHPNDLLQPLLPTPQQPVDNKFRQYQTNITKATECLVSPLPVDIAVCFNATYHPPPPLVGVSGCKSLHF